MITRLPLSSSRRRGCGQALVAVLLVACTPALAGVAGPGVEERPAVTPSTTAPGPDLSVTVFEQLQAFQAQLEALTGRIEVLEHALSQAQQQEKARYLDVDARLKALEQAAVRPSAEAPAVSAPPAVPAAAADADEKALYERGAALVKEKKYDAAIDAFEAQVRQFPRGELVPLAFYWLGEMWLVASSPDAPKAGRYFYRVYNEYPKSTRASMAMYRHGQLQCQGDEVARGRATLNRVIVQFSGSREARLADEALRQQCQ